MSLRHGHHERDVRLRDPHAPPAPPPGAVVPGPPPSGPPGPQGPPPHMNGGPVPGTPLSNGHHPQHSAHPPHPHAGMPHGPPPPHGVPVGVSPVLAHPQAPPPPGAPGGPPAPGPGPAPNGVGVPPPQQPVNVHPTLQKLAKANEETWLLIGSVAEQMGDFDRALSAYESALRHNPHSVAGLTQVAGIARIRENYTKAIEYFQRVLTFQQDNGEVWSALGHCYLMQDDLQKAYSAYQQALYLLPNPKEDPKLWYGIGILYDRYGSLDHAEEAFASVLQMDKGMYFDKANEILFRLGIIYKQQGKFTESLECFDRILRNPPSPLAHADIWFQIGHVYEQQKDYGRAKEAYERVVSENPGHAKVLQQLGWLYHQDGSAFQSQDLAITYLTKSLEADPADAQSWYLLGRAYMAGQKYNKAYEAYQQAVYRDGRNPTFWCSIGVLYFQINQFRDALDAYSRAIRINPYISEVWYDLGSLYESCNNQISDAIDAYARASELDPHNTTITQRLQLLRTAQQTGQPVQSAAPMPQDVHPTAYANSLGGPISMTGAPPLLMSSGPMPRPIFSRTESRELENGLPQPSPNSAQAPPPFHGGPPPPVVIDDSRRPPSHTPLAPMEIDTAGAPGRNMPPLRGVDPRDVRDPREQGAYPPPRDMSRSRGPGGTPQGLLLHHPPSQQASGPEHQRDPAYYSRGPPQRRPPSAGILSPSPPPPPPQHLVRGVGGPGPASGPERDMGYRGYPPGGAPPPGPPHTNGNGMISRGPPPQPGVPSQAQRSPRTYPGGAYDAPMASPPDAWERRGDRERERDRSRTRPRRDSERSLPPGFHVHGHPHAHVHSHSQSRGPASPLMAQQPGSRGGYETPVHPASRRNTTGTPPPGSMPPMRAPSPGAIPGSAHPMSRTHSVLSERSPVGGPGVPRWQERERDRYEQSPRGDVMMRDVSPPPAQLPHVSQPGPLAPPSSSRRYDPRFDASPSQRQREREQEQGYATRERQERLDREREREHRDREYGLARDRFDAQHRGSSPAMSMSMSGPGRNAAPIPPAPASAGSNMSVPPEYNGAGAFPPDYPSQQRRGRSRREGDNASVRGPPTPVPISAGSEVSSNSGNRRRRPGGSRRAGDGSDSRAGSRAPSVQPGGFRAAQSAGPGAMKSPPSPEPRSSASASGSSARSGRPSPTGAPPGAAGLPQRVVDEDYDDDGNAGSLLMNFSQSGGNAPAAPTSPTVVVGGRSRVVSPPPPSAHRNSISSAGSQHHSPSLPGPGTSNGLKRPHSPPPGTTSEAPSEKRTRVELLNRPSISRIGSPPPSSANGQPQSASRLSPVPMHMQPTALAHDSNSTGLPSTLSLPPPPSAVVSAGSAGGNGSGNGSNPPPISTSSSNSGGRDGVTLPPIATLTPVPNSPSSAGVPSPTTAGEPQGPAEVPPTRRTSGSQHSSSPPGSGGSRGSKLADVMNPTATPTRRNSGSVSGGAIRASVSPTSAHSQHSQSQGNAARTSPKQSTSSS